LTSGLVSFNLNYPVKGPNERVLPVISGNGAERNLRQSDNKDAQDRYKAHGNSTWNNCGSVVSHLASKRLIWLRLYPCDIQPGALDKIMDRISSRGYNQVYIKGVFRPVRCCCRLRLIPLLACCCRTPLAAKRTDLLAQAILKVTGSEGLCLDVYDGRLFLRAASDRQSVLARNGKELGLNVVDNVVKFFIDPYSLQAKRDYYQLVNG